MEADYCDKCIQITNHGCLKCAARKNKDLLMWATAARAVLQVAADMDGEHLARKINELLARYDEIEKAKK